MHRNGTGCKPCARQVHCILIGFMSWSSMLRSVLFQVVAQAEKIVARLQRLDGVMPKYQHVMGQLYDLLRVRGLDEVVPAVQAMLT